MYRRIITNERCLEIPNDLGEARRLDIKRALFIHRKHDSVKAKSYRLGTIWKMLDPFFYSLIYLFVFMVIRFRSNIGTLMIGLALIKVLTMSLMYGARSNIDFSGGMKIERVRTRSLLLGDIIHIISNSFIHAVATLLVLLYLGTSYWALLFIPLIFIACGLFWFSVGKMLSPLVNRVNDFEKLIGYFGIMMFFISPVLYPLSLTQGAHRQLSLYNPFSYFSEPARGIAFSDDSYQLLIPWFAWVIGISTILFLIHGFRMADRQRWKWSTWS